MENNYSEMKVKELREECKKRGLTISCKERRFTKEELVEKLISNDNETKQNNEMEETKEVEEVKTTETPVVETKEEVKETNPLHYAKTLEDIEKKYSNRKQQRIYDNELKVGSFVVFIHYVEARDGNIYKKLRTAKVVGVNRKQELVRVQTLLGTEKELPFEDLLYIRGVGEHCSYPSDIKNYLKGQRTEKGKAIINERCTEGFATNQR